MPPTGRFDGRGRGEYPFGLMHRPQAVGLCAVMLSLLVVPLSPAAVHAGRPTGHGPVRTPARQMTQDALVLARTAPQAVQAGTTNRSCTGWRSTLFPPPTIRVLQTRGPDAGKVYRDPADPTGMTPREIPFRDYVGVTMAAEWPSSYPFEVLKAGAIAVKQFAWYYTVVYRGGVDADGLCYDVRDSTVDQLYDPTRRTPATAHLKALAATWTMHLRKTDRVTTGRGEFILTGYRSGRSVPCGSDSDSWRIQQRSAYNCGIDGLNMEQVLRAYIDPRLEIVTPGRHDILGDPPGQVASEVGDISAVIEGTGDALVPHVWRTGRADLSSAQATSIDIGGPGLLGQASEDVDSDGWDDLVVARRTGATTVRLSVASSDGSGYAAEATWWSGDVGRDPDHARLFTGDFTGDMRVDVALLFRGADDAHQLLVFPHRKGRGFVAPVSWWSGAFDPALTQVLAGDVNGDGRYDLLLVNDLGAGGRTYALAASAAPLPGLKAPRVRFTATDLVGDVVKHVLMDVTRDGRDDVVLVIDDGQRTRIDVLRSPSGKRNLVRSRAWRSTATTRLPLRRIKLATSDTDYDGLMDLVVFRDRAANGTEILVFDTDTRDAYGVFTPGPSLLEPDLTWGALHPY